MSPVLGVPLRGSETHQPPSIRLSRGSPRSCGFFLLWTLSRSCIAVHGAAATWKTALRSPLPRGPFPVPGDYTTHERLFLSRRQRCYTTSLMSQMRGLIYSSPSLVPRPFTKIQMPPSGRVLENTKQPRGRAPHRGPHRDFPP